MDVVDTWTGRGATALQQAMRLTNEAFAAQLGTAVRTVAKWSARPETVLTPELQRALDTLLYRAPDDVKARFSLLFSTAASGYGSPAPAPHLARLTSDHRAAEALAWLDRSAGWPPGAAHHALTGVRTRKRSALAQIHGIVVSRRDATTKVRAYGDGVQLCDLVGRGNHSDQHRALARDLQLYI